MPTKILVADDSATMRRVMEMTFAGEDATVVTVDSGEAAVAKASEFLPDVVFADASMKGVDGYELARRIKTTPALAKAAVVVMASQHTPYDDGKGRAAGVDDHISKPFDTQSVIDRVSQVLARPRASASLDAVRTAPAATPVRPVAATAPAPMPQAAPAARPGQGTTRMGIGGPVPVQAKSASPAPAVAAAPAAVKAPPAPTAPARAPAPIASVAPQPIAATRPAAPVAAAVVAATGDLAGKLGNLGLSREQVEGVLALSREVIEQIVWEVVPDLAEAIIKEELRRLTE